MSDEEDPQEKADREYMWRRKCEIFWEIEDLRQAYLKELDYPKVAFVEYVAMKRDPPIQVSEAGYLLFVWKNMKRFSPLHLN